MGALASIPTFTGNATVSASGAKTYVPTAYDSKSSQQAYTDMSSAVDAPMGIIVGHTLPGPGSTKNMRAVFGTRFQKLSPQGSIKTLAVNLSVSRAPDTITDSEALEQRNRLFNYLGNDANFLALIRGQG